MIGILLGIVGALIALGSVVGGMLAPDLSSTLIWLVPECAGVLLAATGLHAWIDR